MLFIVIYSFIGLIINIKKNIPSLDKVIIMFEEKFGGLPLALVLHKRKAKTAKKKGRCHNTEKKEFAKTLYFYSPRANRLNFFYWFLMV